MPTDRASGQVRERGVSLPVGVTPQQLRGLVLDARREYHMWGQRFRRWADELALRTGEKLPLSGNRTGLNRWGRVVIRR